MLWSLNRALEVVELLACRPVSVAVTALSYRADRGWMRRVVPAMLRAVSEIFDTDTLAWAQSASERRSAP